MKPCVYEIIHDCFSTGCMCLQGLNRVGKDSQVGRDGVRRKDWHDYEAIKKDASRSGRSRSPHRAVRHIQQTKDLHITRVTGTFPFLLWVLLAIFAANLCCTVLLSYMQFRSATVITSSVLFSSMQTVYIIRIVLIPETSR